MDNNVSCGMLAQPHPSHTAGRVAGSPFFSKLARAYVPHANSIGCTIGRAMLDAFLHRTRRKRTLHGNGRCEVLTTIKARLSRFQAHSEGFRPEPPTFYFSSSSPSQTTTNQQTNNNNHDQPPNEALQYNEHRDGG